MGMHHKPTESYPAKNADAADLISFSFILACTVILTIFLIYNGIKYLLSRTNSQAFKDEYELTSTHANEEEDTQQLMKENQELVQQLQRAKRLSKAGLFVGYLILTAGLYLGVRAIQAGLMKQKIINGEGLFGSGS
ncbi:uncharacterized protein SAPINGB_P001742 [Magnusiomyces paraingens]|uniref:Uncharacterized protein n=1 Tax=Magnusiomyces paraingens TaxID=2606893 RepID=A0A5E8B778_9ASCO|nr:uncharacterized protein SAPINGB_P001742 [Saprochaete ingens]VVT47500.1 unnamed protein product [Saprochaete ingens]